MAGTLERETSDASDLRPLIRGRYVLLSGRLASMTRDEFVEIVEAHGGNFTNGGPRGPGAGVALVVVGQKDWPLARDGTLPDVLRRTRVMQRRKHARILVLSEEQFLASLGLDQYQESVHRLYTTATLCELLGVAPGRVRAWVKAGLLKPAETRDGVWHFDFRQASAAKTLCDLARSGVTLPRLRRSLEQLRAWLPDAEEPLQQLSLLAGGRVMVRLSDGDLAETDGQLYIDFDHAGSIEAEDDAPPATMRLHAGPSTAAQWYEQAVAEQAAGYLSEAVESYRQALLLGGPDADVCYDLAHALAALGRREQAVERYLQAVEIRPDFGDAWNNLGTLLAELGRRDEACAAFRRALEADPSDFRAHYNLADTLDEMGMLPESLPHWRAYLKYDGTSRWAEHARARLAAGA
ncbi:MAG TPA: tetratricopeptide repeat protein [Tepidisphaeraceae bacterium]|nr:tetratricopeptide repeat protein [Tepidisphaeraceae bacterium]